MAFQIVEEARLAGFYLVVSKRDLIAGGAADRSRWGQVSA